MYGNSIKYNKNGLKQPKIFLLNHFIRIEPVLFLQQRQEITSIKRSYLCNHLKVMKLLILNMPNPTLTVMWEL